MKKSDIFRNTENWYLNMNDCVSDELIEFAIQHAGNNILDVGCATGNYCVKLKERGFNCVGIDINKKYVKKSIENGVESYLMDAGELKFSDNSFDTILLFEVLEHVENPQQIIGEAKRVAKKNVLITVPNSTGFYDLRKHGLTYEHMLEKDHVNFFTKEDLENLLAKYYEYFKVEEREAMNFEIVNLPIWLRYPILIFSKLKLIKSSIYFRLYAIAKTEE